MQHLFRTVRKFLGKVKWGIETTLMLATARLLIKFVPFRYWRETLGHLTLEDSDLESAGSLDSQHAQIVGRWVRRTAEKVPFEAVCLPQAMACRWMLARRGLSSKIFIGAMRGEELKDFICHAWLMHGELCLTGKHEKDSYAVFSR